MTGQRFVPPTVFIAKLVRLPSGEPARLEAHQRAILDHVLTPVDGRLPYSTILWSEPKKSGKTCLSAWVGSWALNALGPRAEVLAVANDLEQGQARIFAEMMRVQRAHPALKRRIARATESILLLDDGSSAKPVALDAAGEAGADPVLVIHDEAWGIMSERARRLYDELTPPPTRSLACRWVSSYAGYSGESVTLEELYNRGLAGTPIPGLPDCRGNGALFMFWSHTPRMVWQTKAYYDAQRSELRPRAYLRLHQNRWVQTEGAWLPAERLDAAVDRSVIQRPPVEGVRYRAFVDNSGGSSDDMVLCIGHLEGGKRLIDGAWDQGQKVPFDPAKAVARFAEVLKAYRVSRVHGDTYGGKFLQSIYAAHGIAYQVCPLSPSELYEAAEVGFNRGDIALPNHARLIEQLGALVEKGGRITHKYGGHDDFSNAAAGCLFLLAQGGGRSGSDILRETRTSGGSRISAGAPTADQVPFGAGREEQPPRIAGVRLSPGSWFDEVQEDAASGGAFAGGRRASADW